MLQLSKAHHKIAYKTKAWPFVEARKLLKRLRLRKFDKDIVVFQTGYGPSGLPHIGTFGEVARTAMVCRAFQSLSDLPTKILCFSDDMDGFRKVPDNLPMTDALALDLHLPLSQVRDPFGTHKSFAEHNNARLCSFLDSFGFDYQFISACEYYKSGCFDEFLLRALKYYDAIMAIILPTLGPERRATYAPFLPISPKSGHVLQVPILQRDVKRGTIVYREPDGEQIELAVTGGHVKMQWKPDWALRWVALGVDYEMSGKDLSESVTQASRICRLLGGIEPVNLTYELFNDELGQKISKSKGNGISIEQWLRYGSAESLQFYMYLKPKTAKRLAFDVIPPTMDAYHDHLRAYQKQDAQKQLQNPVWHIHGGVVPYSDMVISFSMLLNLVSASAVESKQKLWRFINKYAPNAQAATHPMLDAAVGYALAYYRDFIVPHKQFRLANACERAALLDLARALADIDYAKKVIKKKNQLYGGELSINFHLDCIRDLQSLVFAVGKNHGFDPLRDWFSAIYQVLIGASQGPRFGGFIAIYGIKETIALIKMRCDNR